MTDGRIALREMLEKGSDASVLREKLGFAAQRLTAGGARVYLRVWAQDGMR